MIVGIGDVFYTNLVLIPVFKYIKTINRHETEKILCKCVGCKISDFKISKYFHGFLVRFLKRYMRFQDCWQPLWLK